MTRCLGHLGWRDIHRNDPICVQSSWSKGISKTKLKQQSPCSIGLWCHRAIHAVSACINMCCHRPIAWLLHALTAWDLKFQVCLGYTFTSATLICVALPKEAKASTVVSDTWLLVVDVDNRFANKLCQWKRARKNSLWHHPFTLIVQKTMRVKVFQASRIIEVILRVYQMNKVLNSWPCPQSMYPVGYFTHLATPP